MKNIQFPAGLETVPVADLVPYARNARTHSKEQVKQIAASIREFGFTNPVLIDAGLGIIAGHGRVMAAQSLDLKEVPVIRLPHLTEAQKRAYVLADNKIALNSGWDKEMLALELGDLHEGFGYDVGLTGFSAKELEHLMLGSLEEETSGTAETKSTLHECPACGHTWPKKK